MKCMHVEHVKQALRQPHTFPGFYPKHFVTQAGLICPCCVMNNLRDVYRDTREARGAWNTQVTTIWEGELECIECGAEIESAYGSVKD